MDFNSFDNATDPTLSVQSGTFINNENLSSSQVNIARSDADSSEHTVAKIDHPLSATIAKDIDVYNQWRGENKEWEVKCAGNTLDCKLIGIEHLEHYAEAVIRSKALFLNEIRWIHVICDKSGAF